MADNVGLSNEDYVAQIDEKLCEFRMNDKSRKKRLYMLSLVAIALCLIVICLSYFQSGKQLEKLYFRYVSGDIDVANIELLQYKDTYSYFEERHLGNSNTNLLSGGYFAEKNGYSVFPNEDITDTFIVENGEQRSLCGELCSYVNLFNDNMYFRKNSDRKVYRKNLPDGDTNLFIDGNVGQFIIKDNTAFYIDYADNNSLYAVKTTDGGPIKLFNMSVASFVVLGDYAVCLTDDQKLYLLNTSDGSYKELQSNIERFCFNGKLIIQNNGNIIEFGISAGTARKNNSEDMKGVTLISADGECIYFQKGQSLFSLDIESGQTNELCSGYDIYNSIFRNDTKVKLITTSIDKTTNTVTRKSFVMEEK